jgi:hypothetical protein
MCVKHIDKHFREMKNQRQALTFSSSSYATVAYNSYTAADGFSPLMMRKNQKEYLNKLSVDARLIYLAFTHIGDSMGEDANEIGKIILSYVGRNQSEGDLDPSETIV